MQFDEKEMSEKYGMLKWKRKKGHMKFLRKI